MTLAQLLAQRTKESLSRFGYCSIAKSDLDGVKINVDELAKELKCTLINGSLSFGLLGPDYYDRFPISMEQQIKQFKALKRKRA